MGQHQHQHQHPSSTPRAIRSPFGDAHDNRDPFPSDTLHANHQNILAGELRGINAGNISATWGRFQVAVHGTTIQRAYNIAEEGELLSFERLTTRCSKVVSDNQSVLTDCLDIDLGLHRYVFLNLGRVHPSDVHPVYFVFPNKLLLSEGVVVALREIVHFGALVSQERVDLEKSVDSAFTDELALAQNIAARSLSFRTSTPAPCFARRYFLSF